MAANTQSLEGQRVSIVRWVSLADALAHISQAKGCGRDAALAELRAAIGDGRLGARLLDSQGLDDARPTDPAFWRNASIRLDHGGEVLHQEVRKHLVKIGNGHEWREEVGPPGYRLFALDRNDLFDIWPVATEPTEQSDASSLPMKRPSLEEIREKTRQLYRDRAGDPPNMDEASRSICKALQHAGRQRVREVLHEPEFERQRRRPGEKRRKRAR